MELLGFRIGGTIATRLAAAALMLGAAGLVYLGASKIENMVTAVGQQVRQERDAYWQLEIQKANAAAIAAQAEQAKAAIAIEADAGERVRRAEQLLAEREKQNAALPNGGACGLDVGRVRLLPN